MGKFNCFSAFSGRKKKFQEEPLEAFDANQGQRTLQVKLEHVADYTKENVTGGASFNLPVPFEIVGSPTCKVKVLREENSPTTDVSEAAYEGEDEHDHDKLSMRRDFSDLNLQAQGEEPGFSFERSNASDVMASTEANNRSERYEEGRGIEAVQSGHISDPGIAKAQAWGSPKLKRSCSNLERRAVFEKLGNQMPQSNSFDDLQNAAERKFTVQGIHGSPLSVMSSCSADKVMLKKNSSSQVLPSRSRKLWWKLFIWSHRNLHRPVVSIPRQLSMKKSNKQIDGYCSDTLEAGLPLVGRSKGSPSESHKVESPWSLSGELRSKNHDNLPRNQWMAFSSESSTLARVDEWVNTIEVESVFPPDDAGCSEQVETESNIFYPPSPENSTQPIRGSTAILSEEVVLANNVIQSLSSFSTLAHIAGMGLKVIPNISPFASLRSVNLSGNFIVYITPGSLPKGLHTLDLSRNKIATIEGLRELTRLRILDLSYNRISRIGHGLSNCTLIKELYLAGNKISDVEGLHRLLKLTVLDLSFNKITTTKALGQIVANYKSLLALNLLGNPIQVNIGDEQLRKTVSSLLPQLTYLNKQPIKPQRGREVATDSVAKAALGNGGWNSRRKPAKKAGRFSLSTKAKSGEGGGHRGQHKQRSSHHRSPSSRR